MVTSLDLADLAIREAPAQAREVRIEAAVEADHQRRAGLLDRAEAGLDAGAREIDRLLAEHRLAGARAALDQIGMGRGGRADQNGVDVGALDDVVEGGNLGARCGGKLLRGGRMRIGDRDEAGIRMGGGVAPVNAADAACPQNSDPDHASPRIFCRLIGKFGIDVPAQAANRINIP